LRLKRDLIQPLLEIAILKRKPKQGKRILRERREEF